MPQYDQRILELVKQYRYNPRLYSEQQVDELQDLANQYNIPFKRKVDEFNLRKTIQQLSSGFLEGFTTIPVSTLSGNKPQTTYESIAHSLGHLAGFAPGILAAPLKMIGMKGAAQLAGTANKWSIPMMGGDFAKKWTTKGLSKSGLDTMDFMKKGAAPRAMFDQAVHLGTASAVSSVWRGPDEMMNAGVYGAVAGGAFGGLGEIKMIGNYLKSTKMKDYRKGEQRLKSAIGASMLGVPSALSGQPVEMVMYETLLGGYFGYGSRPAVEKEGGDFIRNLTYEKNQEFIFHPDIHPNFNEYSKGARDYIRKQSTGEAKSWLNRYYKEYGYDKDHVDMMVEESVRMSKGLSKNEKPSLKDLDFGYRSKANDIYTSKLENPYEYYVHKDFVDHINSRMEREDANQDLQTENPDNPNLVKTKARDKDNNVFIIVKDENGIRTVGGLDADKIGFSGDFGTKVNGERYVDKPANNLENTEYITFDGVFVKEGNNMMKYKPLETMYSAGERIDIGNGKFKWNPNPSTKKRVSNDVKWKVDVKLHENDRYIFGGIKDKGVFTVRKYHDNADMHSVESIMKRLSTGKVNYSDIKKSFLDSQQGYRDYYSHVKDLQSIDKMHAKAWKSNVLAEADRNGLKFSEIHRLMRDGYSKDVVDWNKREQLYMDKSMPLEAGTIASKMSFALFKDIKHKSQLYKNEKGEDAYFESDTDGTVYFLPKDITRIYESLGLKSEKDPTVSMIKPVIIVKVPGHGTMAVKAAGRAANPAISKYMDKSGIKALIMTSSAKHTGDLKFNDFDMNLLEKGEYKHTGVEQDPISYKMKDSDIRINLGTYESLGSATKKQIIARQLSAHLPADIMERFYSEEYGKSIDGKLDVNKNVLDYTLGNEKAIDIENINVDDISSKNIHEIFINYGHTDLAKKLARQITNMDKNGDLMDLDTFSEDKYQEYLYRNNRVLDLSDMSQSQREAGVHGRKYFEDNYKKYMLKRYYSPKWKYSAKTWMAPKDPDIIVSNSIKDGEFKLDLGMKKMKVNYQGKDMTLGEAWKKSKQNNSDVAFDFLVIRIPSDSISGTRVLKFGGFTKQKGISITTNPRDNAYLGGADKDSDSTFLYQNMPDYVVDTIRKQQNQWDPKGKFIDGKSEKNDALFGVFDTGTSKYKTKASKFSPSFRRVVAETAHSGQSGLGFGIVAKTNLTAFADYVSNKGGSIVVPIITKYGTNGTIHLQVNNNTKQKLNELGREIVNRSADAANYPEMKSYAVYRDMLIKEAFDGYVINKKGKRINFKDLDNTDFADIYTKLKKNSELGRIAEAVESMNPSSKVVKDWSALQNRLEKLQGVGKNKNLASLAAERMIKDKLDNPIFDFKLIENYGELMATARDMRMSVQEKNPIVKAINQLHSKFIDTESGRHMFNPENFIRDAKRAGADPNKQYLYNTARWKMENDFSMVSSWNALNKKGFEIYNALKQIKDKDGNQVYTEKQLSKFVTEVLEPIAQRATQIKQQLNNTETTIQDSNNQDLTMASNKAFDILVQDYKNGQLANHIARHNKKFGDKNTLNVDHLRDYFDLWLLSPFKHGSKDTSMSKVPWQSKSVSDKAIKYLLSEQDAIYYNMELKVNRNIQPEKSALFDIETQKPETDYEIYTNKIYQNDKSFLRTRALTDKQYLEVLDFENTLKNNPIIEKNLRDFYETFTKEYGYKKVKDFNMIGIEDIMAMNKYLKDIDMRTKPFGTKLPDFAWRASPEYMDTYMRNFEEGFYQRSYEHVTTRDGEVLRHVKKYTSTIGDLKHYLNKIEMAKNQKKNQVPKYNLQKYLHKKLPEKQAEDINVLVFSKREGGDYKSTKIYKDLLKEKFKLDKKEYTLDELIDKIDNKYTEDFLQFGGKWIYAKDTKGNYMSPYKNKKEGIDDPGIWIEIDKNHKYGKYNEFLIWNKKDGSFDHNNFIKRVITDVERGSKIPDMPLETIYRAFYEQKLEQFLSKKTKIKETKNMTDKEFREWYRKKHPFEPVGRFSNKDYVPHLNFGRNKVAKKQIEEFIAMKSQEAYNNELAKSGDVAKAKRAAQLMKLRIELNEMRSRSEDGGYATDAIEDIMRDWNKLSTQDLENIMVNHRPGSVTERKINMPGYDNTHNAIDLYKESVFTGLYKNLASYQANYKINKFIKNEAFGKNTSDWTLYLRSYFRDSMGLPTVFGDDLIKYEAIDPKFKRRGVYQFSDEKVMEAFHSLDKQFKKLGRSMPGMKNIPPKPDPKLKSKDPELWRLQNDAHQQGLSRLVHDLGRYEAKFQLITLLGHSKIWAGNMFGGSTNTITRGGMKNFARANNNKWIMNNLIKDANGNYRLKLENNKEVKTMEQFNEWIAEKGIIESFISNELNVSGEFANASKNLKKNLSNFSKDISKRLIRNPEMSETTILEIAAKHKVDKMIEGSAAWFMQVSERKLRKDAFVTHALEYMELMGKNGLDLTLNDPAVFEAGIRGVEATQFLYHSSARPAFMRTSLGKVLSRFKLFVFNSVRIRKEMIRKASYYGFKPGTKDYEKFKTDFAINMFVMALGTAFAYSLFDTAMPPPYDWIQETGDLLLGDKKTRDKAFFGQYPNVIAPLNIVTPPLARIPIEAFSSLINKDWERFMGYHVYTMFPFGRMVRSIDKTIDEPYGTLEGRAMQQFLGLPLDKVRSKIKRAELLEARRQMIESELGEMYG